MGYTDREDRRRKREAQKRQRLFEALERTGALEDVLEAVETEYTEEVTDELTGDTYEVTRTELNSSRLQVDEAELHDLLEKIPVRRAEVSPESLDAARTAYANDNVLELARLTFEIVSGVDPATEYIDGT